MSTCVMHVAIRIARHVLLLPTVDGKVGKKEPVLRYAGCFRREFISRDFSPTNCEDLSRGRDSALRRVENLEKKNRKAGTKGFSA